MKGLEIGSTMAFGGDSWRVLDIKAPAALIIADHIIEQRPYHDAYKTITWTECALRKYPANAGAVSVPLCG